MRSAMYEDDRALRGERDVVTESRDPVLYLSERTLRLAQSRAQGDKALSPDTSHLAPDRLVCAMTAAGYTRLLVPLAALVFVGGWVLAGVAFFVIGTRTCANVQVPLAGTLQVCQDTTSNAVIMLTVIGFAATVGSLFLLGLHFLLLTLEGIESNTRKKS